MRGRDKVSTNSKTKARGRGPLPALDDAALVLVDLQEIFCSKKSPAFVVSWPAAARRAFSLAETFIGRGLPVIVTRHVHRTAADGAVLRHFFGHVLTDEDPLSALIPAARALIPPAVLHEKAAHACFAGSVPAALSGRRYAVLAGVQTQLCVLATAVDLARLGIVTVVAADACAAPRMEDHAAALRVLASGHAHVSKTAAVEKSLVRRS
jgi:nicotinamidase-related amidase